MPKLTRYTTFSSLKSASASKGKSTLVNKQAHAEFAAFIASLTAAATTGKAVKGYGK